jgi:hypothetical protein
LIVQQSWALAHRRIAQYFGGSYKGVVRPDKSHLDLMQFKDELYVIKPGSSGKIATGQCEMLSLFISHMPEHTPMRLFHSDALVYCYGAQTLDQMPNFWDDLTLSRVILIIQRENDVLRQFPLLLRGFESWRAPFHFLAFCKKMFTVWGSRVVQAGFMTRKQLWRVLCAVLPTIWTVQITDQNVIAEHIVVDGDRMYPIDWTPVFRPREYPIARFLAWNWLRTQQPIEYFIQRAKGYGVLPLFAFCVVGIGWDILDHEQANPIDTQKLQELQSAFNRRLLP